MKYIITLFMLISVAHAQEQVPSLQLKGGTVKLIVAVLKVNVSTDTTISNLYQKWREDYIDGSVPTDNANVTISTTRVSNVVLIYSLLLRLPVGYRETTDFLTDFKTSVLSKRNTIASLDAAMTALEAQVAAEYNGLLDSGNKELQSK